MRQPDDIAATLPALTARRPPVALVWVGFWLALVLVGAKAALLGLPEHWEWSWLRELAQLSFRDVLFAFALGAAGEVAARLLARRPRWAAATRAVVISLAAFCAVYGVASYGVFEALDRPLSFDLLRLMRGSAVKSSITDRLTWPLGLAFVLTPSLFLVAALRGSRRGAFSPAMLAGMGLWITVGAWPHAEASADQPAADLMIDRRLERLRLCPHVEIVRSTLVGLGGRRHTAPPLDFPPEDQNEFQPFGNRGAEPRAGFTPPPQVARPKNVILIVLESVGTKYLSLYGGKYSTTPHLIEESQHAVVFDNFYAHAPYTYCTFMAVNFSLYPGVPWCFAPGGFHADGPHALPPTFALEMQKRGYRTTYLHNGDMDWGSQRMVLDDVGYDSVEDFHDFKAPELTSWGAEDRYLIDRLIQWIDEKPGKPFLAYCWTDQTHNPYAGHPGAPRLDFYAGHPPKAHAEALTRYLNVLHETDKQLGRLFAALRERGLADDTLVVVTGDHGEAFTDPHDQQGHGFSVYQEEVNVPLMIWNPRLFPEGQRLSGIGGHVDLNPTIADVLGVDIPKAWQGHSLFERGRPERTFFVASVDEYLLGIRDERWKYVFEMTSGRESLFDLSTDPDEQRNALATEPQRVARLRQRLAAWIAFEDQFISTAPSVATP